MLKKTVAVAAVLVLAISLGACKKKEAQPQIPAGHPGMQGGMPGMPAGAPPVQKIDRTVIVPKEVAKKWSAVKLNIEDKTGKGAKQYVVAVGSDLSIPNTNMKVKVLAFLPDFRMGDKEITSATDKPNNPAAQIIVQEPGKEEWKGWVYSMHPEVHPFQHEKIAITLIGGVSK
jgi:hypothetical protein